MTDILIVGGVIVLLFVVWPAVVMFGDKRQR